MIKFPSSINLAALHRPLSFSTLTGQRHVIAVLKRAVQDELTPQQLLFSGGSGLGKTTVARILASALLCNNPMNERNEGDSCGKCSSCEALRLGAHPDLIEFDAASNGSKDEIREIAGKSQVTPMLSSRRIYIIDEAHGLSMSGGQAFLKLLEEPPAHVTFMLCTTDPQKMLKTNRGRCTEFELLAPTRTELIGNLIRICLAEGWNCPTSVLEMVVDCTDPELGVRGTVNMLSKLSSALSSENNLTVEEASVLLGRASAKSANNLLEAIFYGSEDEAKEIITTLRSSSSEEAIRATLLDLTRVKLYSESDSVKDPRTFRAFEELVTLPKGRHWLDLYVIRLCREFKSQATPLLESNRIVRNETHENAICVCNASANVSNGQKFEHLPINEGIVVPIGSSKSIGLPDSVKILTPESKHHASNNGDAEFKTISIPPSGSNSLDGENAIDGILLTIEDQTIKDKESTIHGNSEGSSEGRKPITVSSESKHRTDQHSLTERENSYDEMHTGATKMHNIGNEKLSPGSDNVESMQTSMEEIFTREEKADSTHSVGFIAAVSKIDPDLAGTLRRCNIVIQDSVVIRYKISLKADIEAGQKILRQVAGRAGLALVLTEI